MNLDPVLSTPAGTVEVIRPRAPLDEEDDQGDPVLGLVYQSGEIWLASLAQPDGALLLVCVNDWDDTAAIARIDGPDPDALLGPAIALALATNGSAFGTDLMGSLPDKVVNTRPDLLTRDTVEASLVTYLTTPFADASLLEDELGMTGSDEELVRVYLDTHYRETPA